jgi:hypothetical protein
MMWCPLSSGVPAPGLRLRNSDATSRNGISLRMADKKGKGTASLDKPKKDAEDAPAADADTEAKAQAEAEVSCCHSCSMILSTLEFMAGFLFVLAVAAAMHDLLCSIWLKQNTNFSLKLCTIASSLVYHHWFAIAFPGHVFLHLQ